MEILKRINIISKLTLICAIIMFFFGILARIIPIYIFWESLYLSGIVFLIGVYLILHFEIRKRKSESKPSSVLIIGKVFIILSICMFTLINLIFNNSDALTIIEDHIKKNVELVDEIGEIESVIALPMGAINSKTDKRGTSGNATLTLLIKGSEKYEEMSFSAQKKIGDDWRVIE